MIRTQPTPVRLPAPNVEPLALIHPPVAVEDVHVEAIIAASLAGADVDIPHDEARLRSVRLLRLAFCEMAARPHVLPSELNSTLAYWSCEADDPFVMRAALRAHAVRGDDPAFRLAVLSDSLYDLTLEGRPCGKDELSAMGFSARELEVLGKDAQAIAEARYAITREHA